MARYDRTKPALAIVPMKDCPHGGMRQCQPEYAETFMVECRGASVQGFDTLAEAQAYVRLHTRVSA